MFRTIFTTLTPLLKSGLCATQLCIRSDTASYCCQTKGRVAVPKQMNFRKSSKGGGRGHFQSKKSQRSFGIFPKIHPFWYRHPTLCYRHPSKTKPNQTMVKFDQDFKTYWSFCLECRSEMAAFIISLIFKLTQKIKSLMAGSVCLAMFFLNISTCSQPSIDIDKTDQRLKVKLRPWPWHLQSCRLWQKWNSFLQGNLTSIN